MDKSTKIVSGFLQSVGLNLLCIFGETDMQELLYEDLSFAIRQCIFEVHNDVGVGYDEETYHQGLGRRFEREGITFVSKERVELKHRGIAMRELSWII